MNLPDGVGQREILIGAGILVVVAIIAIPLVGYINTKNKRDKRDECAKVVDSIRDALVAHGKAFPGEGYISAKWAPREPTDLNGDAVEWKSTKGFSNLGWSPAKAGYEEVRGTYRIAAERSTFKVIGHCDIDGDGIRAEYEADLETASQQKTASDIY